MSALCDKVAIVTGGAAGIGRGTAVRMAAAGAHVVITDVDDTGGQAALEQLVTLDAKAMYLHHDVRNEAQWQDVVAKVQSALGGVDILFNNAGVYVISSLPETTLEMWNNVMAVNVTGTFLGLKYGAPAIAERGGGSIVNASSVAGLQGAVGHVLYGASKGAVRSMTKHAAAEYAPLNVRVNSIHPTYTRTAMADYGVRIAGSDIDDFAQMTIPLGRIAEVDDVANVVVFLCSDDAAFLTGGEYVIDGGSTVMRPARYQNTSAAT